MFVVVHIDSQIECSAVGLPGDRPPTPRLVVQTDGICRSSAKVPAGGVVGVCAFSLPLPKRSHDFGLVGVDTLPALLDRIGVLKLRLSREFITTEAKYGNIPNVGSRNICFNASLSYVEPRKTMVAE